MSNQIGKKGCKHFKELKQLLKENYLMVCEIVVIVMLNIFVRYK
jgi:hypothetical protein